MNSIYTAIIVEPRRHPALEFVLSNFLTNLDNRWNFIIHHGTENETWLKEIIDSKFSSEKHRIKLKNIGKSNLTINEYNALMANFDFIADIPTEHFLIFETDSMICSPYKNIIYDFLEYDYVGAPWSNLVDGCRGQVGNSGLSLRRKSKMLEIVLKSPYKDGTPNDLYFSGISPPYKSINKPSHQKAQEFSIETVYSPRSFGIHKPWLYLNNVTEEQCPGYSKLVSLNRF